MWPTCTDHTAQTRGNTMTEKHDGKLTLGDTNVDLPRVEATVGNDGLSIGMVLRDTEAVTYDPGFMNTANASSAVTYIDGEAGILRYRGFPIEALDNNSSILEVARRLMIELYYTIS